MGCELSKQIPTKKKTALKRITRKASKTDANPVEVPIPARVFPEGSASGTTHSGDSPADLAEVRTYASTPDLAKYIPECFDEEVLSALAQVDDEHRERKEAEFRAILRGVLTQRK